jgi:hypothetical protein
MKKAMRCVILAVAGVVALAVAGSAMAAYVTPRVTVQNPSERLGGGGPLTVNITASKDEDPTFRVVIYVPQGYGAQLGATFGTQVGTVDAQINARAISPDAIVPVTGAITVVDPTPFRTAAATIACNQNVTTFDAVLNAALTAAGQTLNVPLYVFLIREGPEALFAAAKIVACLPTPDIPQAQGGAALGAKLIQASLTFTNVFVNPAAAGSYRWRTLFTPWTPGQAVPNAAGTVEAQSIDTLPGQLSLAVGKYNKRTKRVPLTGRLTENNVGLAGARVQLYSGRTAAGIRAVSTVQTNASGRFAGSLRISRTGVWFFRARVVVPSRNAVCEATFASLGIQCLAANQGGFTVFSPRVLRATLR